MDGGWTHGGSKFSELQMCRLLVGLLEDVYNYIVQPYNIEYLLLNNTFIIVSVNRSLDLLDTFLDGSSQSIGPCVHTAALHVGRRGCASMMSAFMDFCELFICKCTSQCMYVG